MRALDRMKTKREGKNLNEWTIKKGTYEINDKLKNKRN